ncbi:hypothetical protein [Bifidobacterium mongoliense]|uniref:Uncharacterized protein n=1 Tax=Bifidobacterium mongoliense DSM 21395 TaxID=1437603 RepID=A0A087BZD1_9BIFI|nr:hypothetical protein [Bifidobacterium mongoliense]KFI76381.1 hypothetical protein BMON_1303 [Bifidobacterium mongoliense DSM 21395]
MVIKPKTIVGAIALAFGAVSFALSFFSAMPSGICGLIAGILGLACGLDWGHGEDSSTSPSTTTLSSTGTPGAPQE